MNPFDDIPYPTSSEEQGEIRRRRSRRRRRPRPMRARLPRPLTSRTSTKPLRLDRWQRSKKRTNRPSIRKRFTIKKIKRPTIKKWQPFKKRPPFRYRPCRWPNVRTRGGWCRRYTYRPRISTSIISSRSRPKVVFIPDLFGSALYELNQGSNNPTPIWGNRGMFSRLFNLSNWLDALREGNGSNRPGQVRARRLTNYGRHDTMSDFINRLERTADTMLFPYDWRLSIQTNSNLLRKAIEDRWFGPPSRQRHRIILIGIGLGGLIARHYIEYRQGHRQVKRLITVATPHKGAPEIYRQLKGHADFLVKQLPASNIRKWLRKKLPSSSSIDRFWRTLNERLNPSVQNRLFRSYVSFLQLLPAYPFIRKTGQLEPFHHSLSRIRHRPTGQTATEIVNRLNGELRNRSDLAYWLPRVRVRYHVLLNTGHSTISSFEDRHASPYRTTEGDGVVPSQSARLPESRHVNVRTFTVPEGHFSLLQNPSLQDAILSIISTFKKPPPIRRNRIILVRRKPFKRRPIRRYQKLKPARASRTIRRMKRKK